MLGFTTHSLALAWACACGLAAYLAVTAIIGKRYLRNHYRKVK